MRFADVIRTALGSLFQHKLRNTLTLFGVIIGTFVLVLSLSIGEPGLSLHGTYFSAPPVMPSIKSFRK